MMNEVEFSRHFDIHFQSLPSWPGITLDARLAQAWILDLLAVGYEFPKLCLGGFLWWSWWIPEIFPLENHWKSIKAMGFLMCNLAMLFFSVFPSTFSMQVHQVQKQRSQVY